MSRRSHRDRTPAAARAFSLIELVLVIAIIAILGAMALPRYASSLWRYRAEAAARRVSADLALARSEAKQASAARTAAFDLAQHRVQINAVASLDRLSDTYITDLTRQPYSATLASVDLGGDTSVVFDGYGVPDSGGTIVIQAGGATATVVLDAATGEAEVQ